MKAGKILGGIAGVLALAGGGFWFFMIRHPSPEDVCDHVVELAKKEGIPGADGAEFKKSCIDESQQGSMQGAVGYAKEMKCAAAAGSLADLDKCR